MRKILIVIFLLLASPLFAATYYVDATNGNDDSDGLSEANAWKTIFKIEHTVLAGDTVRFKSGEEWFDQFDIVKSSMIVNSYGDGEKPVINAEYNYFGINLAADDVTVSNLEIKNATVYGILIQSNNAKIIDCNSHHNYHEGIRVENVSDIEINGGEYHDNGPGNSVGIWLKGDINRVTIKNAIFYSQQNAIGGHEIVSSTDLILDNLYMYNHLFYAVILDNMTDFEIKNCAFVHNGLGSPATINGLDYRGGGLIMAKCSNGLITGNVFEKNQGWGVDLYVSNNLNVSYNIFKNNKDTQVDPVGPGIGLEVNAGKNVVVYKNIIQQNVTGLLISFNNSGGSWPPPNGRVTETNNIFYSNNQDIFHVNDGSGETFLYQ